MNRKLKIELKSAFHTPTPKRKDEFLKNLDFPKTSNLDFIYNQVFYIRKRVWISSSLILIGALLSLYLLTDINSFSVLWSISSILPFIALLFITEVARSKSYNMAELEMSCKYNLLNIILVRLGILSGIHLVTFTILILALFEKMEYGLIRVGIYLLVPFLLTCVLSLLVLNHFKTREVTYICGGISCFVSISSSIISVSNVSLFADQLFYVWGIAFCILLVAVAIQTVKYIKKLEELAWNLT
ncbi:hypothetical protein EJF36_04940 [Bacillus sp. HMF5848]|uniref:hypothetical protein n=1 Tax=Bacillus sp. HMF5848 TaxID=2495421 RepID=UPI000F7B57F6|nr:hypothetical protein [Bacillus sp. HMF5848]RSK26254.1 hypothetical protein EJF36_04940 [Bacillus sp. HMF5848]